MCFYSKLLSSREKHNLQLHFRAESFNAANHPVFGNSDVSLVTPIWQGYGNYGALYLHPIQFVLKLCSDVWLITRDFYIRSAI
jgi:hypothetical protein